MEHDQATQLRAAERYLLGELSDTERHEFEQHFFACPACAEDVEAGIVFEANAGAVLAERPHWLMAKPGWWKWLSLRPAYAGSLACLLMLLAAGLTYEAEVARGLRRELTELQAPQSYPSFFLRGATRGATPGGEDVIELPRESRAFAISLDLVPGQNFEQYLGEVLSESGSTLFSVKLAKPRSPSDSLNILIQASTLEAGRRYTLIVRGQPGVEIARYHFVFRRI